MHVLRGDGLAGAPVGAVAGLRRLAENVGALLPHRRRRPRPRRPCWSSPAGSTRPSSSSAPPGGPGSPGSSSRASDPGRPGLRAHRRAHGHPPRGGPRDPPAPPVQRGPGHPPGRGWALSLLLPLAAVGIGILGRGLLGLSTDVVLFFLATVIAALVGGLGPALLAAVASGAAAQLLPDPAPVHLHHLRTGERHHAGGHGAGGGPRRPRRRPRRTPGASRPRRPGPRPTLLASFSRTVLARSDPLPRLLERIREAFGLTSVAILQRKDGRGRSPRPRDRRGAPAPSRPTSTSRSTSTSTSSVRAAPWRPPTAGCSTPSPARPCWRCATSRSAPRRPRRSAAPTPPSCAARCCRPSATTCALRSPRSRPPRAACATRTCGFRGRPQ